MLSIFKPKIMIKSSLEKALSFHRKVFVVDGHSDTFYEIMKGKRNFLERSSYGHCDLPRMIKGGINLQFSAIYTPPMSNYKGLYHALKIMWVFFDALKRSEGKMTLVVQREDLESLIPPNPRGGLKENKGGFPEEKDKIGFLLCLEGGEPLGQDLDMLDIFYLLGIRSLSLTHESRNLLADGTGVGPKARGLTLLGKKLVLAAGEKGILIDLAHLAEPGFWEIMELVDTPMIVSHCGIKDICHHPRNLTLEQIKAIAEKGGLVAIDFLPEHIKEGVKEVRLEDVVTHIEYVAEKVGIDYVGIGSDFDGFPKAPEGLEDVSKFPNITVEMFKRRYGKEEVEKVLGKNFLRILRNVLRSRCGSLDVQTCDVLKIERQHVEHPHFST